MLKGDRQLTCLTTIYDAMLFVQHGPEPRQWSHTNEPQVAESTNKTGHHHVSGKGSQENRYSCTVDEKRVRGVTSSTRTHRVALDCLFDRINLDPKIIKIKYVDTKHQLANMLTNAISHVMSGTIFSICRISALPAAQKRWRVGCNKEPEKKEMWQSRSRRYPSTEHLCRTNSEKA